MKKLFTIIFSLCLILPIIKCHQIHHEYENEQPKQQQQQHDPQSDIANQMHINKDHVLEHLEGVINKPKDQMTVDEQNFYYFKLHDYDNNNVLDGLELVTAFAHNLNEGVYIYAVFIYIRCSYIYVIFVKFHISRE